MYILQSIICSESLLLLQRNTVDAWDMKGAKPVFSSKRELQGLELPKGTVIEVELVEELQGEVSHPLDTGQYKYHKICLLNPYCLTNIEKDKWYTVYTFFFNFKWINPLQDFRLLVTASPYALLALRAEAKENETQSILWMWLPSMGSSMQINLWKKGNQGRG